ncbi:MAG TPA: hypothetical protein VFR20_04245 [Burkholderiaceae bacterium]|nr:hypothetical protein [Burkholderiaceae bacterium]
MLQDLDSLAARLGQLVQFTRQLQAERATLQTRLKSLEQERNALREQLGQRESEHQTVAQRLERHSAEIDAVRQDAERALAEMRAEVSRYQTEHRGLQEQLQACRSDSDHLRAVTSAARDSVDAILMRLPGAAQE